ncbi:uncharacterized protein N7498_009076 [Penicillium cinerascens]|uniref:Uncharacterized protein n=1 Tax=Penicillium cinerascens TaxID=70096 RepID=A0A9W9MBA5_9EURO|nr:uncharacterized protein N7498_009076 [Penicillium cinerascens]KAJ5195638.1 hypothetical protein N7498_009076 [Penicillium cinerascens]
MDTVEDQSQETALVKAITESIHQSIHAPTETQSEPSKRPSKTSKKRLANELPPRITRMMTRVAEATKKACLERQEGETEAVFDEHRKETHAQQPIYIDESSSINEQDTDYRPSSVLQERNSNTSKGRIARKAAGKENAVFPNIAKSTKSAPAGRSRPIKRKHGEDTAVGKIASVSTSFSNRSSLKEKRKKSKKPRSTKSAKKQNPNSPQDE